MPVILYLTRNGLLEPLGQSQILPYLLGLSSEYSLTLVCFERSEDLADSSAKRSIARVCDSAGVRLIALRFRYHPRPWAAAMGFFQMITVAGWNIYCSTPRLVHARSYLPAAAALLLYYLAGVNFIFDMRALWPEELISSGKLKRDSWLHRVLLWFERRCLMEASAVVSLTHAAVVYLRQQYPRELAGQRIFVIPTCADLQRFQLAESRPASPLIIGCIGTVLSGWFLVSWLRAFFDSVARVDLTARFELVSRDSPEAILSALEPASIWADRLSVQSASPSAMPSILQRHTASVMFFTSGLSKLGSCPTRMAEALGCGRPVVTNPGVGDVEQVVRQHRVGVLATDASSASMDTCVAELLNLLKDPNLASRCRHTAELLFSLESGISAYRQLYAQILG